MSYRDERGVVYDPVPLPTHEVTVAVSIDARIVKRPTEPRRTVPFYSGTDGATLAMQPHGHRRKWTEQQWLAFEEQRRLEEEASSEEAPHASVWVVRDHATERA